MAERKAVIKNADMSEDMQQVRAVLHCPGDSTGIRAAAATPPPPAPQSSAAQPRAPARLAPPSCSRPPPPQDAVDCASQALEKYNIEKDIAAFIKKEFDKKYNPTWHCIVGRNFGSYVTHETKHFIYFYLGQVAILLFKSG